MWFNLSISKLPTLKKLIFFEVGKFCFVGSSLTLFDVCALITARIFTPANTDKTAVKMNQSNHK